MAKNNVAKIQPKGKTLATNDLMTAAKKYAGKGISDRQEDNVVPLVYLLQSNSPQTQKGGEKYIKGATGGCIWLRNAAEGSNLFDGEEGMVFQPCHFNVCWIEWMPNRGGFVARHNTKPEAAVLTDFERDDGSTGKRWEMPSGNTVQESREYSGFVYSDGDDRGADMPYTLPMGGTNLSVAKQFMSFMRNERMPDGDRAALFLNKYKISTKLRSRGKFSWYVYQFEKIGTIETMEELERGNALADSFSTGVKQSAAHEDAGEVSASDED